MFQIRDVRDTDWPSIAWLASNEVQQADHSGVDHLWVEKRRSFDGFREQAVLESDGSIVGYCAIERAADDADDTYRVFLVADWDKALREIHESLFAQVESMLLGAGARQAWMRELSGDLELLGFVKQKGYRASPPYTLQGERAAREMVILTKVYGY